MLCDNIKECDLKSFIEEVNLFLSNEGYDSIEPDSKINKQGIDSLDFMHLVLVLDDKFLNVEMKNLFDLNLSNSTFKEFYEGITVETIM